MGDPQGPNTTHEVRQTDVIASLMSVLEQKYKVPRGAYLLLYAGRVLSATPARTIKECHIVSDSVLSMKFERSYSLCPQGAELDKLQNRAALDTDISMYVNRLCHTGGLSSLVQLISAGAVEQSTLVEVNADGGTSVAGQVSFSSSSHMLSFQPRNVLKPGTLYTVTLKRQSLHLKKEIAELGHGGRQNPQRLQNVIEEPEYSFTFTTSESPWRKLAVYRRSSSQPLPKDATDLQPGGQYAVALTIVLKNADEVFEGLRVLAAEVLDVDEDEDILNIQSMTVSPHGSLQLAPVHHRNVAALQDGDNLLVTCKSPEPSAKRHCANPHLPQPAGQAASSAGSSGSSSDAGSSSSSSGPGPGAAHPAKERLAVLRDLLQSGLISEQDFEKKKADILASL